ncbi:MAG: DUF5915 domain-containing protein, partial [Oscillospiraceae bacterium]
HITVGVSGSEKVREVVQRNEKSIMSDTLADAVTYGTNAGYTQTWDINGEAATLSVQVKQ